MSNLILQNDGILFPDGSKQTTAGVSNDAPFLQLETVGDLSAAVFEQKKLSTFTNVIQDIGSGWNSTTQRYTPKVKGLYYCGLRVGAQAATTMLYANASVYLNGSSQARLSESGSAYASVYASAGMFTTLELDGVDDYLEFYGQAQGTGTMTFRNCRAFCYLVRSLP